MKGLILAGGTGSRLRPLTHTLPKQLIPLANKPVLEYVIEDLKDAGIDEVGIIVGGEHPGQIQSHLQTGEQYGIDITYIMQGEPLGLAHAVGCARDFIGDDSFVVYFGDTIVNSAVTSDLVSEFDESTQDAGFLLQKVTDPTRYGIAEFTDERLVGIHEKPDSPPSNLAYVGVLILSPLAFEIIAEQTPSWRGELELTDTLNQIVKQSDDIYWEEYEGLWKDVGTPEDVISANKEIVKNQVGENTSEALIGEGTNISKNAVIEGPAIIGDNVEIGPNALVGPYTSIGTDCRINNAQVNSSVVMKESVIDCNSSLNSIIVGSNTKITGGSDGIQGILGQDTDLFI